MMRRENDELPFPGRVSAQKKVSEILRSSNPYRQHFLELKGLLLLRGKLALS